MHTKKIKKSKSKKESTQIQCSVQTLAKPQRAIPIKFLYKLPGELYLSDKFPNNDRIKGFMSNHNYFKRLISLNNDHHMQLINCRLIDYQCFQPPIAMLIQRLQTIGNMDAYNLSLTLGLIHSVLTNFQKLRKPINIDLLTQTEAYQNFLCQNEKLVNKQSKYPHVVWKSSNQEDVNCLKTFEIAFNYKFINLMGFNNEDFIQNLLKNGLPECFSIEGSFFKIFNWILNLSFLNRQIQENFQYTIKTNWKDLKVKNIEIVNKFENEDYFEIFIVQSFEINQEDSKMLTTRISKNASINASYEVNRIDKTKQYNLIVESDYFREDIKKWLKYYYPDFNIIKLKKFDEDQELRCKYVDINKSF